MVAPASGVTPGYGAAAAPGQPAVPGSCEYNTTIGPMFRGLKGRLALFATKHGQHDELPSGVRVWSSSQEMVPQSPVSVVKTEWGTYGGPRVFRICSDSVHVGSHRILRGS
jgi:hypothetical protein